MDRICTALRRGFNRTCAMYDHVEERIFDKGKWLDHYIDRQTPRRKYMLEILLVLPLIFIIHHWTLVAPYSNYKIINIVLLLLSLAGNLVMLGLAITNIRTRLRAFIILPTDLCFAWITNINYWTYQQAGSETCEEVNVIVWTDLTNNYTIPIMITLLIQCIYLWMRLAVIGEITNKIEERFAIGVFLSLTLVDLACLVGIFPTVFSELSYWLHAVIYSTAIAIEIFYLLDLDIKMMKSKIQELLEKVGNEEDGDHKNNLLENVRNLDHNVQLRMAGNMSQIQLPGQWFMRDCLSTSAIVYFMSALVTELVVGNGELGDIFHVEFLVLILVRWTTSVISLVFFCALLTCISNICIGICFSFLTNEEGILTDAMNSNTGSVIYISALILFSESDFLGLTYVEREHAMKIVLCFSFYIICRQVYDVLERKVVYVVNSGTVQSFSFFLRFGILAGLFITVPGILTYTLSQNLDTNFLPLFFASGNMNIMSLTIFLLVQCSLTSLKWHTILYRNRIEEVLHKMRLFKTCVIVFLIFNQAYFRYNCPYFKAWWFYRLLLAIFGSFVAGGIILYAEWIRHKGRQEFNMLMDRLPNVNYDGHDNDQVPDCSICFSSLNQGVVLPCRHSYHRDCVRHWLEIRRVCPTCNTKV
ncbi:hypothetical protein ACF0H5_014191 [Mactra antiquata]